jgi:signal transduction histidine kinase
MVDENRILFAAAKEILLKEGRWSGEVRNLTKDRREVFVVSSWTLLRDAEGNPGSILVIDTDTTEKKQLELQFLRAERFELIGTVGAVIAHDLNNILQVIITNLDLANSMSAINDRLRRHLVDASRGAARATSLASRLLTFSKGGVPIKQHLDIAAILTPAVLLALGGSKLKPLFDLQPDLYPVIGDPVELTQSSNAL